MHTLYRLFIRLVSPAFFAYLWLRGRKAPAYRRRWRERRGSQPVPVQAREGLIIHCVSVGEAVAARALIEDILENYPHLAVTVTAMTPTGSELIQQVFGNRIYHCYLPFDSGPAVRMFLDKLAPRGVLLLETELWPNLLHECNRRHIPIGLVNARLSARSARGYAKLGRFGADLWRCFSFIAAQTPATARRVQCLGAQPDRIRICGNLKQDYRPAAELVERARQWRAEVGERSVIVAGSTHAGEEELVLAAFRQVLAALPDALLILVPRHPERFGDVAQLVEEQRLSSVLRSKGDPVTPDIQVLVGETMGELVMWYAAADVAFVGGSLVSRGGHNPLESVAVNTPVVTGPHVFNFAEIYQKLERNHAVIRVDDEATLAAGWLEMLRNRESARHYAERAQVVLNSDGGASAKMLQMVQRLVPSVTRDDVRTIAMTKTRRFNGQSIWFDPVLIENVGSQHFSQHYWKEHGAIRGNATGRHTAWFIEDGGRQMLLRHYYRGGLIGKVIRDRFLRQPETRSRAMLEYALLLRLRELELPVPEPVAASMSKADAFSYRADIIVRVIPNSSDVFQLLRKRALADGEWRALGAAIRRLHDANVYHSDLNCHNLLLDDRGQAWIVDFDKSGFRQPGIWKEGNLNRLLRSLRKEQGKYDTFYWREDDWEQLLAGYQPLGESDY
jgi:3-deoxy-D-manno-octulosonic-acid transferase